MAGTAHTMYQALLVLIYEPASLCESNFTWMNDLAVTINSVLLVTDL